MDQKAFQSQLISLQSILQNFAYMLTSNRDDANDLVQDTTLKALDNSDKFSENTNFKGWVLTIMRNIFVNNYRRRMRASTVIDRSDDLYQINFAQAETSETPEGTVAANEITLMINSFSDNYRIPFKMHLAGFKYAEIADRTGLPVGTVKSRIFFARRKLQTQLKSAR